MWIFLLIGSLMFTICTLLLTFQKKKKASISGFLSISFLSLLLCSFYAECALKVRIQDWSGLEDMMPTMEPILWIYAVVLILLNSIPFLKR